ncbi:hypothetical protein FNV43_RR13454 [Rhamnella rubrinervis]|uniref:Uncharacterized protein n=1 Tax=Rhamnella rubrinervis TaxID=2594499 RepID=A0A8K0ME93_9ROSA|nr:hypothetical protein FNV43_RR13454 [Rhamnella rubrinervis]
MAMKFFTQLGSCCGGCCTSKLAEDVKAGGSSTCSAGHTTSSLTSRSKVRSPRSETDMHWQPALSSISEDGLVPLEVKGNGTQVVVSQKKPLSSSNPITIAKAHSFSYGDDEEGHYRRPSRFMVIPAFSQLVATPFMF